jgi:hypothetical protein
MSAARVTDGRTAASIKLAMIAPERQYGRHPDGRGLILQINLMTLAG